MIIHDGEILDFKCKDCGFKFKQMIGYGPICPNPELRKDLLRKNPTVCPECKSKNFSQTLLSKLMHPC